MVMPELDAPPSDDTADKPDWPARTSQMVVHYVGLIRDKTTGPVLVASRQAVYFFVMGLIGILLLILLLIFLVRTLVVTTGYLPFVEQGEPWLAYLLLGTIFTVTGVALWRLRLPQTKNS